jgi:N6-L-threonylcarbamoyladenine synthase
MKIIGIESSCDETAVSVLDIEGERVEVIENLVSSQVPEHQKYGGVVPEVAARMHVPETVSLVTQALDKVGKKSIDLIAVTQGPGLPTALQVGLEAARLTAWVLQKPLIGVNHLEGHLASAWLNADHRLKWHFPLLALVVSGGHTELVLMKDFCEYEIH